MQKLREMTDGRHFCHPVTQPKMLALLKKAFIEPREVALIDRILSMEDGFEYLLKNRHLEGVLTRLKQIYKSCDGKSFSPTYQRDPDFVAILAKVRLPCTHLLAI